MTFVRPRAQVLDNRHLDVLTLLGGADSRDGRALDLLARALLLTATGWPLIVLVRVLLLLHFIGIGHFFQMAAPPLAKAVLSCALLFDLAIVIGIRTKPIRALSANRRLLVMAPMVMFSSLLFHDGAAMMLVGGHNSLLAVTLTPTLIAMGLFGRQRLLSLAYALGALIALALHDAPMASALSLTLVIIGFAVIMAAEFRLSKRAISFAFASENRMTDDQAKAMLDDFERSGRGWFWETDRAGNVTYVSATLAERLNRPVDDLTGMSFTGLIAKPDKGDAYDDGQRTIAFHLLARTAFSDLAVRAAGADSERWWSVSGQPMVTPFGQFLGFRGSGSDLTEMRRSQAEVARLASFDSLTGLANRPQMLRTLGQTLNPRPGIVGDCTLFLLDLDRFKEVNDTMGHPAGDTLLRQVGQRLLRLVDSQAKVGRLGGDEFQIIFPGLTDRSELGRLADRIIHNLCQPYHIDGSQVVIGASIGVAIAPVDGTTCEMLIRNADLALYAAKADGRRRFRFFAPAMHVEAEARRQLEQDLRYAVATGALGLEYQAVVCASTERITGFECLVRWDHPQRGPISPAEFIPIAEDIGLINQMGEWVLRKACHDAVKWPEGVRVAVNVSPAQFINPALPALVTSALTNSGLPADLLELEITENVFLSDVSNGEGMFTNLKAVGIRLALDDFGTGYSALGYLKNAPFDKIKIDQSFVRGAAIKGSRNAAILKSIVTLAEALGMETTAEGAETLDELALIRSLGCSHVQGFVYGRPVDVEATLELFEAGDGYVTAHGPKVSREPRQAMLRTVTLCDGANSFTGRIRNISKQGAMITGLTDIPVATRFTVALGPNYELGGICRWSEPDRMGVEFDEQIDFARMYATTEKDGASGGAANFYRENWPRQHKQAS